MNEVILQVALDLIHLHRALKIAEEAVNGGVDWIEAGTPLIKSEGMNAVRELKKKFSEKTVVADMKTMDVGGAEVDMAAKSGADIAVVMGAADDETIRDSIRASKKYNCSIMVDLMNVDDPPKRAEEVESMGASYICVHVGIDEQMTGKKVFDVVKNVKERCTLPVAAAGGLNSETAVEAVKHGADIIIVGGAIIKAPNVSDAARKIKESLRSMKPLKTSLYKKYHSDEELYEALMKVSSSNASDAMHHEGSMHDLIPILPRNGKMVGKAFTVRTIDGDWAKPVEAIEKAPPGSVIVIDAGGGNSAVWGELASWSCRMKGINGVIIEGAVRDVQDIREMEFPVFARKISPNAGEPKGYGEIGVEVVVGGQRVKPGDWIIGDESGVTVIPRERASEVANRALDVMERENRIREEIKRGNTLSEVLELEKWENVG